MKNLILLILLSFCAILTSCEDDNFGEIPAMPPVILELKAVGFDDAVGTIDEANSTIALKVPRYADIKNLVPNVLASYGSTITPAAGTAMNFTTPQTITIENS